MKKIISIVVLSLFLSMPALTMADTATTSDPGLTPDNPFYFFKTLKENIQTFFIFNAENKAMQFLHLADVRMAEYQKMVEKGKTEIAQKTLNKYEKQLNKATQKIEELKSGGKDIKKLSENLSTTTAKHIKTLGDNLQKVPEAAKKGIEKVLENLRKGIEKFKTKDETADWKTYINEKYGFSIKYPADTQCGHFSENSNGDFNFGMIEMAVLDSGGLSLSNFVDNYLSQNITRFNIIDSKKQVSINAGNAVTVTYRFGGTNKYGEMTFLKNNANIYAVGFTAGGFDCNEPQIFPQMLSTFKFIK